MMFQNFSFFCFECFSIHTEASSMAVGTVSVVSHTKSLSNGILCVVFGSKVTVLQKMWFFTRVKGLKEFR